MPFILILVGLVLALSAYRNTTDDLFGLLKDDVTGQNNFIYWILAVVIIGSVGYVKKLRPVSDGFLLLILVVMFVSNRGFFDKFTSSIENAASTPSEPVDDAKYVQITPPQKKKKGGLGGLGGFLGTASKFVPAFL